MANISQSYLRAVELEQKQPTIKYIEYICDALGITLEDFFCTSQRDELQGAVGHLSVKQQNALLGFLRTLT